MEPSSVVTTIIIAVFGSGGFWALITALVQRKQRKNDCASKEIDLQSKMLKGLAHDRIVYLGGQYIEQGEITKDEYENLNDYLYQPYKGLKGNGTAEKVMEEVRKLPLVSTKKYKKQEDSHEN